MTRCRHALPSPELAGAASWELLKEWARRYPDLRPCPKQTDMVHSRFICIYTGSICQ